MDKGVEITEGDSGIPWDSASEYSVESGFIVESESVSKYRVESEFMARSFSLYSVESELIVDS